MALLQGSRCTCGRLVVPARRYCPDCQRKMGAARIDERGVVETHTTILVTPEGFDPPIHVGIIRLTVAAKDKPPVRVLARSLEPLISGQAVTLAPEGEVFWATAI
jgi:uncharacterized OB-fold protein